MRASVLSLYFLFSSALAVAAPPAMFVVQYDAGYGKFSAKSARSLQVQPDTGIYELRAETRLTLLGGTLSSIEEYSSFNWDNDVPLPLQYRYTQKGLGSRERSAIFDDAGAAINWRVDDKQGSLAYSEPVYDDLNSFMVLRAQLLEGRTTLNFKVLDKSEIKAYQYEVVGTETIATALGAYPAIHISRIREAGSARTTDFWLAPEFDYLLLRLHQTEPDGRVIRLDVREITFNGEKIAAK